MQARRSTFNPITGEGVFLERTQVHIDDFPIPVQYLPNTMLTVPLIAKLIEAGTLEKFLQDIGSDNAQVHRDAVIAQFLRVRNEHDFCFWAATLVYIKQKGGGNDVRFVLNHPQRRLINHFEQLRLQGQPIRLILLKARQWGGSTAIQIYMAWLQLCHKTGLNSLIVGHIKDASTEVKDMFDRMLNAYPITMLYPPGYDIKPSDPKMVGVGQSVNIHRVPARNCKIKIGTAEKPDSARGGDYNLVHCTEVGLWTKTEGKTPEQIVRSACSGILLKPYTMIVYESTANGTGNFFQREYDAAKAGQSQFDAMFVPWFEIEQYTAPIDDVKAFARQLYSNRQQQQADNARQEPGRYLWWLWEQGATLEAINWYIAERSKYTDHGDMASEYPSDDIEAFVHSGARVFDRYHVERLKGSCRPPKWRGDIVGEAIDGEDSLQGLHFVEDTQGNIDIWTMPEIDKDERVEDRYLCVVDVGGRGGKADYSVIVVFDRVYMLDSGGKPTVVAQWYGHIDIDLLTWKAAQIAAFYDDALLVIESNTLETRDPYRYTEGDQSSFILNQLREAYPNLYARKQSEEDIREHAPVKYGFHTNVATKPKIITSLVRIIRDGLYVERDARCLDEYLTYERKKNGAWGAILGKHDDLLMTRAIGLYVCFYEMPLPQVVSRSAIAPRSTRHFSGSAAQIN